MKTGKFNFEQSIRKEVKEIDELTKGNFSTWFNDLNGYRKARKESSFEEIKKELIKYN